MLFCTIFFVIKCICRFLLFRSYAVHLRQFHMWDLCCNCCIHYYFCDCLPCIIFYGMSPFILVDWCVGRHRHRRPFQTICHFNLSHFVTFVCALSRRQQAQSITTKNWNQSVCVCVCVLILLHSHFASTTKQYLFVSISPVFFGVCYRNAYKRLIAFLNGLFELCARWLCGYDYESTNKKKLRKKCTIYFCLDKREQTIRQRFHLICMLATNLSFRSVILVFMNHDHRLRLFVIVDYPGRSVHFTHTQTYG